MGRLLPIFFYMITLTRISGCCGAYALYPTNAHLATANSREAWADQVLAEENRIMESNDDSIKNGYGVMFSIIVTSAVMTTEIHDFLLEKGWILTKKWKKRLLQQFQ